jgi:hypothetical protein
MKTSPLLLQDDLETDRRLLDQMDTEEPFF